MIMTNRYRPAPGHHQFGPDPTHYSGRDGPPERPGPFPHWFRGHPSRRYHRGRPIRAHGQRYSCQDPQSSPQEVEWWKDTFTDIADSRRYSSKEAYRYGHRESDQVDEGHYGFHSVPTKPPVREKPRDYSWYRQYNPSRSQHSAGYPQRPVWSRPSVDTKVDRSSIPDYSPNKSLHPVPSAQSNPVDRFYTNGAGESDVHNSVSWDRDKAVQRDTSNSPKCLEIKGAIAANDWVPPQRVNEPIKVDSILNSPRTQSQSDRETDKQPCLPSEKSECHMDNATTETNIDVSPSSTSPNSVTVCGSETDTEILALSKIPEAESELEDIQSVLAKRPVVKLTRLSEEQLLKYSSGSPSGNAVELLTAQTVVSKSPSHEDNLAFDDNEDSDNILLGLPGNKQSDINFVGSRDTDSRVVATETGPDSLMVDPKVMPMSLVLRAVPGSGKAEHKVFTCVKPRAVFSKRIPVKKSHVGHLDINKLKERFREAMASRGSHVIKKLTRTKLDEQDKTVSTQEALKHESDTDKSSEEPPPPLVSESSELDTNVVTNVVSIEDNNPETGVGSVSVDFNTLESSDTNTKTDSYVDCRESTETTSGQKANNSKLFESTTVSLEDACKACEALVNFNPGRMASLSQGSLEGSTNKGSEACTDLTEDDKPFDNCTNGRVSPMPSVTPAQDCSKEEPVSDTPILEIPEPVSLESQLDCQVEVTNRGDIGTSDTEEETPKSDNGQEMTKAIDEGKTDHQALQEAYANDKAVSDQLNGIADEETKDPTTGLIQGVEPCNQSTCAPDCDELNEISAADAAEGLLCLAKSGARVFPSNVESAQNEAEAYLSPMSEPPPLTNVENTTDNTAALNDGSSAQLVPQVHITESQENTDNSTNVSSDGNLLKSCPDHRSDESMSDFVAQPTSIPPLQPTSLSTTPASFPTAQSTCAPVVPPPTYLVFGPVQLSKNAPPKAKQPKPKAVREKVLRPLLPKTNDKPDREGESANSGTGVAVPSEDVGIHQNATTMPVTTMVSEPELLDLSMKSTKNKPKDPVLSSPQDEVVTAIVSAEPEDITEVISSRPETICSTDSRPAIPSHENSLNTDQTTTSSWSSQFLEDSSKSHNRDGEVSNSRLTLLISNLRENLGKKTPSNRTHTRGQSSNKVKHSVTSSGTNDSTKAAKAGGRARKTKGRGGRGKVASGAAKAPSIPKVQVCSRAKATTQGVVKVFYTRLRAKAERKRNRRPPTKSSKRNHGGSRRHKKNVKGLNSMQSEITSPNSAEDKSVVDSMDTSEDFSDMPKLVADQLNTFATADTDIFSPEDAPSSDAVDLSVKPKRPYSKHSRRLEGRRRKKGKRKQTLASLVEYKKRLGCEDTDDLPTILPPKRRRTQPQKKPMEESVEDNVKRLAQEFPRHNWLEKKIKNITVTQKKSSETDSSNGGATSPVPSSVPRPSSTGHPGAEPEAKSSSKTDESALRCPPALLPVVSPEQRKPEDSLDPNGNINHATESKLDTHFESKLNPCSGQADSIVSKEKTDEGGEAGNTESDATTPFTVTLNNIIHKAMASKVDRVFVESVMGGQALSPEGRVSEQAGRLGPVSEYDNKGTGINNVEVAETGEITGGIRGSTVMIQTMEDPACVPSSRTGTLGSGSHLVTEEPSSRPIDGETHPESDRGNFSPDKTTVPSEATPDYNVSTVTEEQAADINTDPSSSADRPTPLNLSVKTTGSNNGLESDVSCDIAPSQQQTTSGITELTADITKIGPPVLKVHPQVKQVENSNPEQFINAVKDAVRSVRDAVQSVPTPLLSDAAGTEERSGTRVRAPVPPVPALVPVASAKRQWSPPRKVACDNTGAQRQWTESQSTDTQCGLFRSNSADSAVSGPKTSDFNAEGASGHGQWKRSSLGSASGECESVADRSSQLLRPPASPPMSDLQVLIKEFNRLQKQAEEKEKELKWILALRRRKKDEMFRLMRQKFGEVRQSRENSRSGSSRHEGPIHDSDWLEVFKLGASISSSSDILDSRLSLTNRNNNNNNCSSTDSGILSSSPQHPMSGLSPPNHGDQILPVSPDAGQTGATVTTLSKPAGKRQRPSEGIDLSAKRRLVSSQCAPPRAHSNSSVESVWSMMDAPTVKKSTVATALCPYVPNSTMSGIPDFPSGGDQSITAHPAHAQQPFQTAGVIITAQSKNSGVKKGSKRVPSKSDDDTQHSCTSQSPQNSSGVPQAPPQKSPCPVPDPVPGPGRSYQSGGVQQGQSGPWHMTLPVASPTKFSPSGESTRPLPEPPKSTMLEYVDLSKSPENIVRRVPLPAGFHVGHFPAERFGQAQQVGPNALTSPLQPNTLQPNPQLPQHRSVLLTESERKTHRDTSADRQRKQHPPGVSWSVTPGNSGMPLQAPDGVQFYHQGLPQPVMSHSHPLSSTGKAASRESMGHSTNVNMSNVQKDFTTNAEKLHYPTQHQKEQIPTNFNKVPLDMQAGQFIRPPPSYRHATSTDSVLSVMGQQPTSAPGHHPPQLVQALVSPTIRPRMTHFMPMRHRMPDPRQSLYKPKDPQTPAMRPHAIQNSYPHETMFHQPQQQGVPMQRFSIPNTTAVHLRMPNSSAEVQGSFVELPRGSHSEEMPQGYMQGQPFSGLPGGLQGSALPGQVNHSPLQQQKSVRQSPVAQTPVHQNAVRHSPGNPNTLLHNPPGHPNPAMHVSVQQNPAHQKSAQHNPAHQNYMHQTVAHANYIPHNPAHQSPAHHNPLQQNAKQQSPIQHNTLQQSPLQQSPLQHNPVHSSYMHQNPLHPAANHPFGDRRHGNPHQLNRTHVTPRQGGGDPGHQARPQSSRVDFTCAECNRKASMICSRCELVRYCSKDCQIKGWYEHGQHCKARVNTR